MPNPQSITRAEAYEWSLPIGGYPPLYSKRNLDEATPGTLFCLLSSNLCLRFVCYPFCFSYNLVLTAAAVLIATLYNIAFLLGGGFSASWFDETGRQNQIAIKRVLWLIFDGVAFLLNQLDLIIGLFSRENAIKTLHYLKEISDEQSKEHSDNLEWDSPYLGHLKRFTNYLRACQFQNAAIIIAAMGAEPVDSIVAGIRMSRGEQTAFHEYCVNPITLSPEQASKPPVLLLHGDQHNQSAFIPMLAYLYQKKYAGPIFTVNIPSVEDQAIRHKAIDNKLRDIDNLYRKQGVVKRDNEDHIRCIIIGHSWGADEAVNLEERDTTPRQLILIGACKHSKREQPQVYINAKMDLVLNLLPDEKDDVIPKGEIININSGHLGLISHPITLKKCHEILISEESQRFFYAKPKGQEVIQQATPSISYA